MRALLARLPAQINALLARASTIVRTRFGGKLTYASVPNIEGMDWTPFDIISVDAHRSKEIAHLYQQGIRALVAQGKIQRLRCLAFEQAVSRRLHHLTYFALPREPKRDGYEGSTTTGAPSV
jgi:hypothetical protein